MRVAAEVLPLTRLRREKRLSGRRQKVRNGGEGAERRTSAGKRQDVGIAIGAANPT